MISNKEIQKQIAKWKNDPIAFINKFWPDTRTWDKLEQIAISVRDNKGTVVPSGHGIGKSFISAKIALWYLFTHFPSKVITTAPTWTQVESILWGEIRGSILSSKFPLVGDQQVLNTEIKLSPEWYAQGISTTERVEQRKYGSTKFQGFHSPHLLVIMDEAPGVDSSIHTAIETLATGAQNRILKIGNPTSPSGNFYNNCYSNQWTKIQVSCFDHPNVKEKKELIPGAVTVEWIERMREEWGEDSPLWAAKVLGEFPDESEDTLIPLSWIEKSSLIESPKNDTRVLGGDIARFGDDWTIFYSNISNTIKEVYKASKSDTAALAGRLVNIHKQYDKFYLDEIGVGAGLVDMTKSILNDNIDPNERYGYKVIGVNNCSKPSSQRFFNLRAEMYWYLRETLNPDAPDYMKVKLPDDPELKNQIASIKIKYSLRGQIQIESKDDMKKRGLKSPDKADALCLAVWGGKPHKPQEIIENPIYKEFFESKMGNQKNVVDELFNE